MESKLFSVVDAQILCQWLLIAALAGLFIIKEWPGIWEKITKQVNKDQLPQTLATRLDHIEAEITEIKEKLNRDYGRINDVESKQEADHKNMREIKTEQGIIMRALLGALNGLQELGANGSTETAKEEIVDYLNKQAHQED